MQARAEAAQGRVEPDCTFKPALVTRGTFQVSRHGGSVFDTLYEDGVQRQKHRVAPVRWQCRWLGGRGALLVACVWHASWSKPWCT